MAKAPLSTDVRLNPSLLAALRECAECSPHSPYIWKPKSMQKLAAHGLVQAEVLMFAGRVPYSMTPKGLQYLETVR